MHNPPWIKNTKFATTQDFDHDGICDALDNYLGPGKDAPAWMQTHHHGHSHACHHTSHGCSHAHTQVPWNQDSPFALRNDFDNDGICDALDDHFGPGA